MKTGVLRQAVAPLAWYYAIAVGAPIANGATLDAPFLEHAAFVFAVPLVLVAAACVPGLAWRRLRARRDS
jgi:hypothetical protein